MIICYYIGGFRSINFSSLSWMKQDDKLITRKPHWVLKIQSHSHLDKFWRLYQDRLLQSHTLVHDSHHTWPMAKLIWLEFQVKCKIHYSKATLQYITPRRHFNTLLQGHTSIHFSTCIGDLMSLHACCLYSNCFVYIHNVFIIDMYT